MSTLTKNERQTIDYKALEKVPGLTFRHFSGEEDYALALELWLKTREFNGFDWTKTLEDVKNDEKWRTHFDINEQQVYVELNGEPIGTMEYNWNDEEMPSVRAHYVNLCLLEDYWDTPIPQIMLDYCEEKAAAMTADTPADVPDVFHVWGKQKAEQQVAFFKANGYVPERYFFEMIRPMDTPLAEHPMPEGLELRKAKPEDYRKIWDANDLAFRDHWGYEKFTEDQYQAWLKDRLFQPKLWAIAWDGDEVAGQVENYLDEQENTDFGRKRGYTETISVGRKWRKRGLAKAMIAASIRMFKEMGMEETALGVDAENPSGALKLYTSMGYQEEPDKTSMALRKQIR